MAELIEIERQLVYAALMNERDGARWRKPVEEYLAKQKRFRHLFKPARQDDVIAHIQAVADANAERFGIDIKAKTPSE